MRCSPSTEGAPGRNVPGPKRERRPDAASTRASIGMARSTAPFMPRDIGHGAMTPI
jgi:hypothetical protein